MGILDNFEAWLESELDPEDLPFDQDSDLKVIETP
jgi:hypothetical protein